MRECLIDEVEFITDVDYEESMWIKVRGGRRSSALYIGCVYMPTDCTNSASNEGYENLKRMYLVLRKREGWYCLGILIPGLVSP